MTTTLEIRHRVPVSALIFEQWLPEGRENGLRAERDDIELCVWLDRDGVDRIGQEVTDEVLASWLNIRVVAVNADASIEVDNALADFIIRNKDWPRQPGDIRKSTDNRVRALALQYGALGERVLEAVVDVTNRLAWWAYAERGHYWTSLRKDTAERIWSFNIECDARVRRDKGPWVRWCPPGDNIIRITASSPEHRIRAEDWPKLTRFVAGHSRPSIARELMTNGFALLDAGHLRSAVVEGVCALELSLNRFAERPRLEALRADGILDVSTLTKDVGELGFRKSVRYLLPLLLPPDLLPPDLLDACLKAIDCRGNIVHNGQRTLTEVQVRKHLAVLSRLSDILQDITLAEERST